MERNAKLKSTNVRIAMMSTLLRALAAASPSLAARALERLFLSARRFPVPKREQAWLAEAERFTFESRGQRLLAHAWGSGPTVLLVHGWDGRGSQLGAFVAPLVASGFRVLTFDAPGHGGSDGKTSSLVEMADAIVDARRHGGALHAVIAHSAGAAATSVALSQRLEIERAVFIAPPADLGAFLHKVTRVLALPDEVADLTRKRVEKRFQVEWRTLRAEHIAPSMRTPLLVIHDEGDRDVSIDDGRRLAQAWPGAELAITSGLGHRRILRDENVIADAVAFVRTPPHPQPGRRLPQATTGRRAQVRPSP